MLDVAVLLVSELVANAVLHARTAIRVVIRLDGSRLRIEVHDGDRRAPARKHYSALSTTGRGILLLERLAQDWGVVPARDGKSVWFELDATAGGRLATDAAAFGLDLEDDVDMYAIGEIPARPGARAPEARHRRTDARMLVGACVP